MNLSMPVRRTIIRIRIAYKAYMLRGSNDIL